jgi:hypothetical protein
MNYLQRFRHALAALTNNIPDEHALNRAHRQASMETGDWLGQLHEIARRLPPRQSPDREGQRS